MESRTLENLILENEERLITIEAIGNEYIELLKKVEEVWNIR